MIQKGKGNKMSERDLDDLFREFGNNKPYYGTCEWKAELEKNRQARQICQDFAWRVKNKDAWREGETRAQLAAVGYFFEPWYADGWHR
jgi:hypothetical protein